MEISGVTRNHWSEYEINKNGKSASDQKFANNITSTAQTDKSATLHGSNELTGDIAISSWADVINGSSSTVYKTQDFNPAHPVYKVVTWDKNGNTTERMVDVSKVDPQNCDTVEMYAYTANLKETGKGNFKETVLKAAIAKAASHLEQQTSTSWDYSKNVNWVETVKELMQSAYSYGDLKGYLEWQKFLGLLEK